MTCSDYDGEIMEIETESGVFKCTPEHLMPVIRNGYICLIKAGDLQITDELPDINGCNPTENIKILFKEDLLKLGIDL